MRFQSREHILHPSSGERRGDGNILQIRPRVEQFNEEQESDFRLSRREYLPHPRLHTAESVKETRRNGDSGNVHTHSGGGVQVVFRKTARPKAAGESPTYKEAEVTNTLNTFDLGSGARVNELVVESVGRGSTEI